MSKSFREQLATARDVQLPALLARIKELEVKAANEFDTSLVKPGAVVDAVFGRGEKKRSMNKATVIAVRSQDKGADQVRIQAGEGFDVVVETVLINHITSVYDAEGNKVAGQAEQSEETEDRPLADPSV
jgi:hypothetical protein